MKNFNTVWIWIVALYCCSVVQAQEKDTSIVSEWNHSLEGNLYFMRNDFYFLPVYSADKDWLHVEARYNYEDMKTFSAWAGYIFSGGNKFRYTITPMTGFVVGNTNGIAPGLEFDFALSDFELYSESEYVFDLQHNENNFFYNWTDFTYSPVDFLWIGLSAQLTKSLNADLEFERGLMVGGGYRWFELTAYGYNLATNDPYLILTMAIHLPE